METIILVFLYKKVILAVYIKRESKKVVSDN